HEEAGRWWRPQGGEDVDRRSVDGADDLGDARQVLVAEANPEPREPPVPRHLLLVDRRGSDPHAARLRLPGHALTQLRDVALRLLMMEERLRRVRALRPGVVRTDEEKDPIGLLTDDLGHPDQPLHGRLAGDGADGQ